MKLGTGLESVGKEIFDFQSCYETCLWYGTVGYLGTDDNPYFMAILFEPYKQDGYNGWDEVDYTLHADTKIIATIGSWYNPKYEGTIEQFNNIFVSEIFKNNLNEMETRKVICTDGTVDTLD